MTELALAAGSALVAFSPFIAMFGIVIYQKAQLVIVVTSAAFFFLLSAVGASMAWWFFDKVIGLSGPLAAIIPGVLFQFLGRCCFVALYHRVERVIQISLHKHYEEEMKIRRRPDGATQTYYNNTSATVAPGTTTAEISTDPGNTEASVRADREERREFLTEAARLRLQLNDASCGVAAGVGFGGMHVIMLYGTLLANQASNNIGVLYQESCPALPSLAVSAIFAFVFSILDVFWMLFTFFGMRRRLMFHRGEHAENDVRMVGSQLGNSRTGGNLALVICLGTHLVASVFTTPDYFKYGCIVSLTTVGGILLVTAFLFWSGVARIYMPPVRPLGEEPFHED